MPTVVADERIRAGGVGLQVFVRHTFAIQVESLHQNFRSGRHATTNQYRGMAPGAKILVQALDLDGEGVSDENLQANAARTNAFISNNSWHYAGAFSYDLAASRYDA